MFRLRHSERRLRKIGHAALLEVKERRAEVMMLRTLLGKHVVEHQRAWRMRERLETLIASIDDEDTTDGMRVQIELILLDEDPL